MEKTAEEMTNQIMPFILDKNFTREEKAGFIKSAIEGFHNQSSQPVVKQLSNEEIDKKAEEIYPVEMEYKDAGKHSKEDSNKRDREIYIDGMKAYRDLLCSKDNIK